MRTGRKTRRGESDLVSLEVLESRRLMASDFTVKSGNWSDPTVWSSGTVPGAGDVATLNFPIIITGSATIGTSTAGQTALTINSSLTIADGASLTLEGNAVQANGVVVTGDAGGEILFDSTHATDPSTTWTWQIGNGYLASTDPADFSGPMIEGTAADPFQVESAAGGGNGRFTSGGIFGAGGINAQYCAFVDIGDASNPAFAPEQEYRSLTFSTWPDREFGVDRGTVGRVEQGDHRSRWPELHRLDDFLGKVHRHRSGSTPLERIPAWEERPAFGRITGNDFDSARWTPKASSITTGRSPGTRTALGVST